MRSRHNSAVLENIKIGGKQNAFKRLQECIKHQNFFNISMKQKHFEGNLPKLNYDYKHIATNFNIRIRVCDHCK